MAARVRAVDVVQEEYRDSDGYWIYLKRGYQCGDDRGTHGIVESTKRDARARLASVVPCTCADCAAPKPKYDERPCAFCAATCSTHPDAGNPLSFCGDCGKVTCPDHRVDDMAERCVDCAAIHYRTERAHARHKALVGATTTRPSASFWVFSRTWWKRNPNVPGGREPGAGRRTTLARVATEDEARAICRQYNDTHDPGLLSRKAEYEQLS